MIALDTNILVYAHREDGPFHVKAARCLAGLAEGTAAWAVPWPCVHEFIAVVTHPRIYEPPTPLDLALETVEAILQAPTVLLLSESDDYWPVLRSTIAKGRTIGPRVHDARIAALCQQHGVRELWSADRDFSRFPDVRVVNPLAG